ncbi:MAG TPA: sensor histidine kinase [Streptosporangiaceae bacterium]|jgi:signal transduction histidine kinase
MLDGAGPAHPAGIPAGWPRWAAVGVYALVVTVGAVRLNPSAPAAATAAAVSVAAAAVLVAGGRPRPLFIAVASAGIAVLGINQASNVGWFAVCLLAIWYVYAAGRLAGLIYGACVLVFAAVELVWFDADPGWGAWMGGMTLSVLGALLVRHEIDLVSQLRAAQAGLAERARAEERSRIGRELHDVIAHTLTVSLLHITSARLAVEHEPDDAARALAEAERLGRESLEEVRTVVGMLHEHGGAGRFAPLPGADTLPALVERFRSAGADVTLSVHGDPRPLPATTGLALYRILQEALTNTVKHAPGAPVRVRLTVGTDAVRLEVDSAGKPGVGSGLGLLSMRERAELLGGTCTAGPGGQGWLVTATLPLTPGQPSPGQSSPGQRSQEPSAGQPSPDRPAG